MRMVESGLLAPERVTVIPKCCRGHGGSHTFRQSTSEYMRHPAISACRACRGCIPSEDRRKIVNFRTALTPGEFRGPILRALPRG
jgi:hypothetical protein